MRKLFIVGVSAVLLAGGVSSCKKTTKGKMSNDWTVSSNVSETTSVNNAGDKTVTTVTLTGDSGTRTSVTTPTTGSTSTTEKTAVVRAFTYTIEKDGSWKKFEDITWTTTFTGGSSSDAKQTTTSGTWSFVSKNKTGEFKQNERVIFSVLAEDSKTVSSTTTLGVTTSSESSRAKTYAEGEATVTYVVVESKAKELQLKTEFDETSSSTAGGTTNKSSRSVVETLTLVQK